MTNTILTLHDPSAARRYYDEGLWRDETLYLLLQKHAAARPQDFALRDGTQRLSWAALLKLVDAVAADLDAAGVKRGERVAVWLPNRVEAVAVFLACSRQGYVCNPSLHQNYTVAEIIELLARTRAAALFAQPGYGADARTASIFAAVTDLPSLRKVYTLGDGAPESAAAFPEPVPGRPLPTPDDNPDSVVYLAFTSGTTGTPKGVMHSANTLLANARAMVEDWHHDERSVLLSLSPLSHHIATVALAQSLAAGMELVVNAPPPGMTPLDWIIATGATYVMGVPTHAMDILAELRRRGQGGLGRVADPDRDRAGLSRQGHPAAERLRHDRERLAPVHPARGRPADHRRDLRARLRRLRNPHLRPGQPGPRGAGRRGRRDRRPRRLSRPRLFRQPAGDRSLVQPLRLVHERRSRPARRARLPRIRRPQEGSDHPRRPQHPPGPDRGTGDAASGGGARRRLPGRRCEARRKGLPRGCLAPGRAGG